MKRILLIIFLIPTFIYAQIEKKDLYITYNDCNIDKPIKIINDTLTYEIYALHFDKKIYSEYKLRVDDSGNLIKTISLSGKAFGSLSIEYINKKNNNEPKNINLLKIDNEITIRELVYSVDTNFTKFFEKFKNIYLVEMNEKDESNISAKKVTVKFKPAL